MESLSSYIKGKYLNYTDEMILSEDVLILKNMNLKYIHPKLSFFRGDILDLSSNNIKEIPTNFIQNSQLILSYNKIRKIPLNIYHEQRDVLVLDHNLIEELPEKLIHTDRLDISYNKIKQIPKGFQQGKIMSMTRQTRWEPLNLTGNPIEFIHEDSILNPNLKQEIIKSKDYQRLSRQRVFLEALKN